MLDFIVQAIGFLGMALYIGSYQCRSGRMLLRVQAMGAIAYALHFFLLTAYAGAFIQLATAVNCSILSFGTDTPGSVCAWRGWKWVFALCFIGSTALTWQGIFDLLPCVSSIVTLFASWTRNGGKIRVAKLFCSGPAWLIYDAIAHSYSGVLTQIFGMTSIIVSVWRYGWKALDQKN